MLFPAESSKKRALFKFSRLYLTYQTRTFTHSTFTHPSYCRLEKAIISALGFWALFKNKSITKFIYIEAEGKGLNVFLVSHLAKLDAM